MPTDRDGRLQPATDTDSGRPMRLWEVTRWGNDVDPDTGFDTNFLVVAPDHLTAARLVEALGDRAESIFDLGTAAAGNERVSAHVVRGPYLAHKLDTGGFTEWHRDERLDAWVATPRSRDGVARCAHADGTMAAQLGYAGGQPNGVSERWYPDGTPLSRETYAHGRPVGTHEWWYASGRLARQYEYVEVARNQVELTVTEWDRDGEVVSRTSETQRLRSGSRGRRAG